MLRWALLFGTTLSLWPQAKCMSEQQFCARYGSQMKVDCVALVECRKPTWEGKYGRLCDFMLRGKPYVFKRITANMDSAIKEVMMNDVVRKIPGVLTYKYCISEPTYMGMVIPDGGSDWATEMYNISALPLLQQTPLYVQVGVGLSGLHTAGVIHGDLKPENVLMTATQPPVVSLIDLGGSCTTSDLCRVGTKAFAPPERHVRPGSYTVQGDYKIDSWSFAMFLFAMHTRIGGKRIEKLIRADCWDFMTPECYDALMVMMDARLRGYSSRMRAVIFSGLAFRPAERKHVYRMTRALQRIHAPRQAPQV